MKEKDPEAAGLPRLQLDFFFMSFAVEEEKATGLCVVCITTGGIGSTGPPKSKGRRIIGFVLQIISAWG